MFGFVVPSAETKKPKIQNLSERPETFGFFGFPMVFWFSNRNPKKSHVFFWILGGKPKKHRFFLFSCSVSGEKPKNPCVFLDFCWKPNTMCFFWISVGKQKNPRTTKKSKSFGPLRKVLDFWIFWFFGSLSLRANTARST